MRRRAATAPRSRSSPVNLTTAPGSLRIAWDSYHFAAHCVNAVGWEQCFARHLDAVRSRT
jgi:hypothetical protein